MKKTLLTLLALLVTLGAPYASDKTADDWNKDFYLHYLSALTAESGGKMDDALEGYLQALAAHPESLTLKEDSVTAAVRANKAELVSEIAPALEQADTKRALAAFAQYSWAKNNLQDALSAYERAIKLDPYDGNVMNQYITLLSNTDWRRAVDYLENYAKEYSETAPFAYMQIARIYGTRGDARQLIAYYDKATLIAPEMDEPYMARADVYERLKDYPAALKEYRVMEKRGKLSPEGYKRMGMLNILSGDQKTAKENFETLLSKDPSSPPANQFLAAMASDEGDYALALKYTQASADYKDDTTRQLQAAVYASKIENGGAEMAKEILKNAFETSSSTEIGYYYAVTLQEENQHKEAVKILKKLLKQSPDYERAQVRLALSLNVLKKDREFEKLAKKLYADYPSNETVLNMYGYFLAEKNKNLDLAETMIKKALLISPEEPAYMDSYGWLLYRKKDFKSAFNWLKKAELAMSGDPELAYHLAMVYHALGDAENAVKYLEKSDPKIYKKYIKEVQNARHN